jgi:hypothetical protein
MKANIANVVENRLSLMNDRNKEMNSFEDSGFQRIIAGDSELTLFMRQLFTCFINNTSDAKFDADAKCWSDVRNFQIALRSASW